MVLIYFIIRTRSDPFSSDLIVDDIDTIKAAAVKDYLGKFSIYSLSNASIPLFLQFHIN